MKLIGWKTEKLGPFFSQNRLFWLKFRDFVKKTKNRSKKCVFVNSRFKFGFFVSPVYFQSVAAYNKFVAPKTEKSHRFFWDFGGQNHLKNVKKIEIIKENTL